MINWIMSVKSWLKISYTWIFCGGRSHVKLLFKQCQTLDALMQERSRIKGHIGLHQNHWAYRDFESIYHERKMELFYGW